MGRQARIKRERRHARGESPASTPPMSRTMMVTMPLPGAEHEAGADGHFDDCEVCRALRAGDQAGANELIRKHGKRIDISDLRNLDLTPFLEWLKAEGIDPNLD
jgi:hypothetical protein